MKKLVLISFAFFLVSRVFGQADIKLYAKYDFIPGDKIIFEDNIHDETVGEFPSRWKLIYGSAEVMKKDSNYVIAYLANAEIMPNMKTPAFLPVQFTIEFDLFFYNKYNEAFYVVFDKIGKLDIRRQKISIKSFSGENNPQKADGWHHVAIAFNNKKMKVYFDEKKVLNIPDMGDLPTKFSISALSFGVKDGNPAIIKNIRLAEGGMPLYKRLMADGKIITRGILFDTGKSSIKPESMGVINEVAKMLQENATLKLSIEGHTDSDGEAKANQTLSEKRSAEVKRILVELGIDAARLETKGFGASKPINPNKSVEDKANNRRVEFIKL
ncbi:MAG: OmpA family protein [Sphingobacteriaceae bacterium]|nr:OmpA family protein [Sphingobacteriaceae bacterium]